MSALITKIEKEITTLKNEMINTDNELNTKALESLIALKSNTLRCLFLRINS